MAGILSWMIQIALKTVVVVLLWVAVKVIVRKGGGTFKDILETLVLAIRYGCLNLKAKLVDKLIRENAEEKKETEEQSGPGVKAEGTVV